MYNYNHKITPILNLSAVSAILWKRVQFPVVEQRRKIACVKQNETISFDQNRDFDCESARKEP